MSGVLRVAVCGAKGRMGSLIVETLDGEAEFAVAAQIDLDDSLEDALDSTRPDVLVDVTGPDSVGENGLAAVRRGVRPVLGASGLSDDEIARLRSACEDRGIGGLWVPNFSLGAALLQRFAVEAVLHFPDVEVVEAHHPAKVDAPSGTALNTAGRLAEAREGRAVARLGGDASRGRVHRDIPVHALRLPGLVAEQEVRFGGVGETLSLRHVTSDRRSFMPGVMLACRAVVGLSGFRVGLDQVLFPDSAGA